MSEMAGTESVPDSCGVCRASSDDEPQFLGACLDTAGCIRRFAGIVQRKRLMSTGGVSGQELETRITQQKESRDQ